MTQKIFQLFSGCRLQDTQTGLRAIPKDFLTVLINLTSQGYAFEFDALLTFTRQKLNIQEIPISTVYIDNNRQSHFNPLLDSLRIYFVFFRYAVLSIISACIDFILFFIGFYFFRDILFSTVTARMVSSIFNFMYCKKLIFKSDKKMLQEAIGYFILAMMSLLFSYALVNVCFHVFKFNIFWSKLFSDTFIFIGNFIMQRQVIFKKN